MPSAPALASSSLPTALQPDSSSARLTPLRVWWRGLTHGTRWSVVTVIALGLALLVELLVFNYSALTFDAEQYPHRVIALPQQEQLGRNLAVLTPDNPALTLTELNLPVKTVYLQAGYGGRTLLHGQLYLKDDARAYAYSPVSAFAVVPIAERDDSGLNPLTGVFENDGWGSPQEVSEVYLQVWPFGNTHELRLEFKDLRGEVGILALELNKPLPIDISLIRIVLMTMGLLLIYTLAATAARQQEWAVSGRRYRILNHGALAVALCGATYIFLAMSPWVSHSQMGFKFTSLGYVAYGTPGEALLLPRPQTETEIINSDAYTQLLDAFLKGQLNIDVTADARLPYLDNTYDASERALKQVPYLFDRAYYEGKFYPYFGVTPLFLLYLPIYLITGMVPAMALATYLATILALVGLHLGSTKLTALITSQVNPLLFFILKVTFYQGSMMLLVQTKFMHYSLPYLTGCFCLGLLIWALPTVLKLTERYAPSAPERITPGPKAPGPRAPSARTQLTLYAPLVLLGLGIVGIAGARPLLVALVICLVPPCAWYLWRSAVPNKIKLSATAAVAVPVALGAILLTAYNYARFDSVFEFGQFKQLTAIDNNFGHFQWSFEYIKAVLFHGFCENFESSAQFPFIRPNSEPVANVGNFYQSLTAPRSGLLAFPYYWLLPLVVGLIQHYRGARTGKQAFARLLVWGMVATIAVAPVCQVIGAFSAGTTIRYLSDTGMMWTYIVLLSVLHLRWADASPADPNAPFRALSYLGVIALCLWTLIECSFLTYTAYSVEVMFGMHPELWVLLSRIFAPLSMAC